jgi:hypothetical protein
MTNQATDSIGTASMDSEGTLHLRLISRGPGPEGIGHFSYKVNDPNYAKILAHIGPIGPGETCPVKPWPEETENV